MVTDVTHKIFAGLTVLKVPFAVDRRRKSLFLNGTVTPRPFRRDPSSKIRMERKCGRNNGKWRNRMDTWMFALLVCPGHTSKGGNRIREEGMESGRQRQKGMEETKTRDSICIQY